MARLYRVGEVAALTGVSVRALHHYHRIGLLRPSAQTEGGHRLYGEADLLRLQQILTLRYLGFPLRRIGELLDRPDFDLAASLRVQQHVLHERMAELERVAAAVGDLLERRLRTGRWEWGPAVRASSAAQRGLQEGGEHMYDRIKDLYTPENLRRFQRLAQEVSPEEIQRIQEEWAALIQEVGENLHLDPADPKAQALAERWEALVQATFRGHQDIMEAVGENYRQGKFQGLPGVPQAEHFQFIQRVQAARGKGASG
ncbi:MAG TPA: MerR family transcriptional regulator [Dehalococcoidia bacterium]